MRPKILAVSSELPWPLDTGGKLRTFHIQKALAAACDVRVVVPVLAGQIAEVEALKGQGIRVVPALVRPRTKWAEVRRLLYSQWRCEPYVMFGRHRRPEVFAAVEQQLQQQRPDVVWLDHIDSLLFEPLSRTLTVPTIIDLHNVYSLILDRLADEQVNWRIRYFLRGETKRMRAMERRVARTCNVVLAVSESEAEYYRTLGAKNVRVVPNGVDCGAFASLPTGRSLDPLTILFVGTLSWGPNVSAAISLAKDIFPAVQAKVPGAKLLLVGKDPSPEIQLLGTQPGVTVAGSVPSIVPYLEQATLLAVPLDSGGGTRLKILEAFAAGLPVVSTKIGAEGIDCMPGEQIIIAERAQMAAAIVNASQNAAMLNDVAVKARALANEKYDWQRIGQMCVETVKSVTPRLP
ncbi:glycosyltransferase family 4 protein [soil metagenome]